MGKQTEEEVELRHYLLGELGEEARWAVEERLFLDGDYLLRLQAQEDELLDAYVYGDLAPGERDRVETELLSRPGRREDLKFAHALRDYLDAEVGEAAPLPAADSAPASLPPRKTSFPFLPAFFGRHPAAAFALAAAAFVLLALVVWQVSEAGRRRQNAPLAHAPTPTPGQGAPDERRPPQGSQDERASAGGGAEGRPVGQRPNPPRPPLVENGSRVGGRQTPTRTPQHGRPAPLEGGRPSLAVTVLLLPTSVVRGGDEGKVVELSSEVGAVNLQLPIFGEDEVYSIYRATLRSGGKTVRSWSDLKSTVTASDNIVQVRVPAELLRGQSYEITLAGVAGNGRAEELRTYSFRVQKN